MSNVDCEQPCASSDQTIDKATYLADAEAAWEQAQLALNKDDLNAAAGYFASVLEKKVAVYGDLAPECADVYYRYGITILERVQMSKDIMGDAVAGAAEERAKKQAAIGDDAEDEEINDAEDDDEDEAEEEDEAEDAVADNDTKPGTTGDEAMAEDEDGSEGDEDDEEEDEEDGSDIEDEDEDGAQEEDENAVDELQMAWEALEVAMTIYSKDKEANTKQLSAVHLRLGDARMENGLADEALKEYDTSLQYSDKLPMETERRARAEIHFRKAIALSMMDRPLDAQKDFREAKQLLQLHIDDLRCKLQGCTDEEKETFQATIKDLEAVVADVGEQELDMVQQATETESRRKLVQESMQMIVGVMNSLNAAGDEAEDGDDGAGPSGSGATVAAKPAAPVTDLGVVGRGKKRITPVPMAAAKEANTDGAAQPPSAKGKRSLDTLMSGDATTPDPSINPFAHVKPSGTPAGLKGSTPLIPVVKKLRLEGETGGDIGCSTKTADAPSSAPAVVPAFLQKENVAAAYASYSTANDDNAGTHNTGAQ